FNVTDGAFHTLNEIIESICTALGRRPPRLSFPSGVARSVAFTVEKGFGLFGLKAPVTSELVDKYTEDIAVDGGLIQKELGFVPQYDLQTGWHETISEMRRNGQLR
ncbi:MAG: UDP-glucose 4-epimerase, partial [Deltaproteobacteria bacterium SM23_61]